MSREQLPTLSGIKSQTAVLLGFVNKCLGLQAPVGFEHVKRNLNQVLSLYRFYRVSFSFFKKKVIAVMVFCFRKHKRIVIVARPGLEQVGAFHAYCRASRH